MSSPIDSDLGRFKDIVKGKVRKNLKQFMSDSSLTGQTGGGKLIKIPLPGITIPHFTFGGKNGGTGQGDGEIGDSIGKGKKGKGNGPGAGEGTGDHMHTEMEREELAQILQEELELPNIENKGKEQTETIKHKYNDISKSGPMGLRHLRRTYKNALKRNIISGTYDPNSETPKYVIPEKQDFRYKHFTTKTIPDVSVMICYCRDYSGSMTDQMTKRIQSCAFWVSLWLEHAYGKKIEERFFAHDTETTEMSKTDFFAKSQGGGTRVSSLIKTLGEVVQENTDRNVYCLQFSDDDNFGSDDALCIQLMNEKVLPFVNLFCYGSVADHPGQYYSSLKEGIKSDKCVLAEMPNDDAIMATIKTFLGTGK